MSDGSCALSPTHKSPRTRGQKREVPGEQSTVRVSRAQQNAALHRERTRGPRTQRCEEQGSQRPRAAVLAQAS